MRHLLYGACCCAAISAATFAPAARAETITHAFAAEDDAGRVVTGSLSYESDHPPFFPSPEHSFAEFAAGSFGGGGMAITLHHAGESITVARPPYADVSLFEITVGNDLPSVTPFGTPAGDSFTLVILGVRAPVEGFDLILSLRDPTGTAFGTHLELPTNLGLGQFAEARLSFTWPGPGGFRGRLTSLAVVPEPGSLGLMGLGVGLVGAAAARRRKNPI